MKNMSDLYEMPGRYLVDHPNARRAIAKRVACMTAAAALAVPAVASAKMTPNPGGIGQYHAPNGASLRAI